MLGFGLSFFQSQHHQFHRPGTVNILCSPLRILLWLPFRFVSDLNAYEMAPSRWLNPILLHSICSLYFAIVNSSVWIETNPCVFVPVTYIYVCLCRRFVSSSLQMSTMCTMRLCFSTALLLLFSFFFCCCCLFAILCRSHAKYLETSLRFDAIWYMRCISICPNPVRCQRFQMLDSI